MLPEKPAGIPVIYSESYYVEIGDHVFPTSKYRLIKARIDSDSSLREKVIFVPPSPASEKEILLVHTPEYVTKLKTGTLTPEEEYRLEIPYSEEIVRASFMTCGGTIETARRALGAGAAVHLGGGFHHAFPDHGEGFCIFNDVAVSIKVLRKEGLIKKAMVIDCDLHQGNGTAYIFRDDDSVFTFSIHQENNYPFKKPPGDLDIGLRDYTRDDVYLVHLAEKVPGLISSFKPDLILYVAGADPYEEDQLGNLKITKQGLRKRDNFVLAQARNFGVPVAVVLAGGYAFDREDTVDIHFATIEECVRLFT